MVMLLDWFVASFFFFPVLIVAFIVLWAVVEHDELGWSVFISLIMGTLFYFKFPQVSEFMSHPTNIVMVIGLYIVIGIGWGFTKWMLTLRKVRSKFIAFRDNYIEQNKFKPGYFNTANKPDTEDVAQFIRDISLNFMIRGDKGGKTLEQVILAIRPLAERHKASIILWIAYWPLSIIWFIVSDMLSEIAEAIYNTVATAFQKISDRMFSNLL